MMSVWPTPRNRSNTAWAPEHWSIITVYDADQQPIHRSVTWILSGLEVSTELGQGDHRIAMVNHGRAERFGDDTWDLQQTLWFTSTRW